MDRQEVESKVKKILAQYLKVDVEKLKPDSNLVDDLGIDSFDTIEIVFAIEDEFNIDIPNQDMIGVKTIQAAVDYIVMGKINAKNNNPETDTIKEL